MSYLHDDILDGGITLLDSLTENLYLCSAEPTTFAQASSTYKLGTKSSPAIGAPFDRTGGGREVIIAAITDGVVNAAGDATHYALTDDSASKLLAAGSLSALVALVIGAPFTSDAFAIGVPDVS